MTDRNPVPPETFANALESLDTDALAALVAEAYAATADAVTVTGPQVTATDGDRRTELLAVATADEAATADAVDAVVVADGAPRDGRVPDGVRVVTPTDLRRRLLYAVPPRAAPRGLWGGHTGEGWGAGGRGRWEPRGGGAPPGEGGRGGHAAAESPPPGGPPPPLTAASDAPARQPLHATSDGAIEVRARSGPGRHRRRSPRPCPRVPRATQHP